MIANNEALYNGRNEDILPRFLDKSVDFVCIDPPYTDGKKDVLAGHKIQTKIDILAITHEHYRVLKDGSFYAVFGAMPTIIAWYNAAIECGFKFVIDIVWAKRKSTIGGHLNRAHELIFPFRKGDASPYKREAKLEDTAKADVYLGIKSIESVFRELSHWKSKAKGNNKKEFATNKDRCSNDPLHDKRYANLVSQPRGKEDKVLCTVWSFLPHNQSYYNNKDFNVPHPTVKPIPLLERLIELCTPPLNQDGTLPIVLDSYMGSGTTILACQNTSRQYIGIELDGDYFRLAKERVAKNKNLFI